MGPARSPSVNSLKGTCKAGNSTGRLSGIMIEKPLTLMVPPDLTDVPEEVKLVQI